MLSQLERNGIASLAAMGGVATSLLRCLAEISYVGWFDEGTACGDAGLPRTQIHAVLSCLRELAALGLLEEGAGLQWRVIGAREHLAALADKVEAITYFVEHVHRDASTARVVLTRPAQPSKLEKALSERGFAAGKLEITSETFGDIARSAKRRFVAMTPFLDAHGATWLLGLLGKVAPSARKTVILRYLSLPSHPSYPEGYETVRSELAQLGVHVSDYCHPRANAKGLETFHAKVLLADDDYAYIGSANMNKASLEHSMELGVLLRGEAATDTARVIDAILSLDARNSP